MEHLLMVEVLCSSLGRTAETACAKGRMMIVKTLSLLLIFLVLSGCSSAFTSTPAGVSPTSGTQAQGDLPTAAHIVEPTDVPITPSATAVAQTKTSPTDSPTATSTPMPAPTSAPPPAAPAFSYPIGAP